MKLAAIIPISLCLLLSACWNQGGTSTGATTGAGTDMTGKNSTSAQNCACDEFPFPAACSSKCEVGEATIESVNVKEQTATVSVRSGTKTELRTIPLSKLPAGQPTEKGAVFRTLLKKETAPSGSTSKIVRLAERTK